MDLTKKDRYDRALERKFGYKKVHEKLGSATYILEGEVNKRVDLARSWKAPYIWFIWTKRADSVCPYNNRKCSEALDVEADRIFFKKLKKMERIYWLATLKKRILGGLKRGLHQ